MAKDYARATFNTTRAKKKRSRRIFFYFSLFVFVFCLISGWFIYQFGFNRINEEKAITWINGLKNIFHRPSLQVAALKTKVDIPIKQEPEIHFDFYTELPEMRVALPTTQNEIGKDPNRDTRSRSISQEPLEKAILGGNTENKQDKLAPSTPLKSINRSTKEVQYVVQVGAYKNETKASEIRVSILLAGFDAKVVKTRVGAQVIYRIQQGSYASLESAKIAQKKLQTKGFNGVVQRIG